MLTSPVHDWGSALATALAAALVPLLGGVGRLAAFLAVCFVGWLAADVVAGLAARLLRVARFEELVRRAGLGAFSAERGPRGGLGSVVGGAARWGMRLLTLVLALEVLGLPLGARVLTPIVLWLPNVVAAVVALVGGGLAARALDRLVRVWAGRIGIGHAEWLGLLARGTVWAFAIAVALTQLGIAPDLINVLFAAVVVALALGFGLAAGLGGQEVAGALIVRSYRALRVAPPVTVPPLPAAVPDRSAAEQPSEAATPSRRRPAVRRRGLVGGPAPRA
jgi:hypothetical protein